VGQRDRQDVTASHREGPYREQALVQGESGPPPWCVPVSRRTDRLWRVLRSLPILLIATLAIALGQPWFVVLAIAWGLVSIALRRVHAGSLNTRLKALTGSLARNAEPMVVARGLEAIAADARAYPVFQSIAVLFLAIARARSGNVDGALQLLIVVEDAGWLRGSDTWQAWLVPWLSQLYAARGDLEAAQAWLEAGRQRLPEARRDVLVSPTIVLELRRGRDEVAIAAIDSMTSLDSAAEAVRDHYALLRAFASERAGRALPDDEVRRIVTACTAAPHARPFPLERWWADLASFVDRHA
jgi:hypothetical protein